jgi:hypothetical protein
MEQVPGVYLLQLNGNSIASVSPARNAYEIQVDLLPDRNLLVIELEKPQTGDGALTEAEWGIIALLIRTFDPVETG